MILPVTWAKRLESIRLKRICLRYCRCSDQAKRICQNRLVCGGGGGGWRCGGARSSGVNPALGLTCVLRTSPSCRPAVQRTVYRGGLPSPCLPPERGVERVASGPSRPIRLVVALGFLFALVAVALSRQDLVA
jgi:hypothetical protein